MSNLMHTDHPDTHTHGFRDDCERCQEFVRQPNLLDSENMRRIWGGEIHTKTDMDIYNVLYRRAVTVQRLAQAVGLEDTKGVFAHGGKR